MRLDRVYSLVEQYDYCLEARSGYGFDLYDDQGQYVDTLHSKQIDELQEEDFIEYYLND